MSVEDSAKILCHVIDNNSKWAIGRNGATEQQALIFYNKMRSKGYSYPSGLLYDLEIGAGIFPATPESIDNWAKEYISGLEVFDVMACGWFPPLADEDTALVSSHSPTAKHITLGGLEPYYVEDPDRWTSRLNNKRVAVVSNCTETMQKQLKRKEFIWGNAHDSYLPSTTDWRFIQTGYSPRLANGRVGWPEHIRNWEDACSSIVNQVISTKSNITIIGCGGLGMIIAMRLRKLGISVIVTGGATQLLFGIKGQRWTSHPNVFKLWNDYWCWPDINETPSNSFAVEGSCYWK